MRQLIGELDAYSEATGGDAEVAKKKLEDDIAAFQADESLQLLRTLQKAVATRKDGEDPDGSRTINHWRNGGIAAVPIEVVKALVDNGLGWGAEYKHRKDVMHFELTDQQKPVVEGDAVPVLPGSVFRGIP